MEFMNAIANLGIDGQVMLIIAAFFAMICLFWWDYNQQRLQELRAVPVPIDDFHKRRVADRIGKDSPYANSAMGIFEDQFSDDEKWLNRGEDLPKWGEP